VAVTVEDSGELLHVDVEQLAAVVGLDPAHDPPRRAVQCDTSGGAATRLTGTPGLRADADPQHHMVTATPDPPTTRRLPRPARPDTRTRLRAGPH
jgi:hypothetical protein